MGGRRLVAASSLDVSLSGRPVSAPGALHGSFTQQQHHALLLGAATAAWVLSSTSWLSGGGARVRAESGRGESECDFLRGPRAPPPSRPRIRAGRRPRKYVSSSQLPLVVVVCGARPRSRVFRRLTGDATRGRRETDGFFSKVDAARKTRSPRQY
mmetsp:Transcript_27219/g.109000  ORF Transcript_27219/g.109000 Transcript_27219/m.109000 type:complete len:155 (-) Transcript_27219:204-668(-)